MFWSRAWSCQRPLCIPMQCANTLSYQTRRNAVCFRPLGQTFCFSIKHNHDIPASIPHLLTACSPHAIFWAIGAVVVFALKRMLRAWPLSHVGKKLLKRVPPRVYGNPTPSIIREGEFIRIFTPHVHTGPRIPGGSTGIAVSSRKKHPTLFRTSVTGLHLPAPQCTTQHNPFSPTIAATVPSRSAFQSRNTTEGNQEGEVLSRQVNKASVLSCCVSMQTPATLCVASAQGSSQDLESPAAVTETSPICFGPPSFTIIQAGEQSDGQPAKPQASYIFDTGRRERGFFHCCLLSQLPGRSCAAPARKQGTKWVMTPLLAARRLSTTLQDATLGGKA